MQMELPRFDYTFGRTNSSCPISNEACCAHFLLFAESEAQISKKGESCLWDLALGPVDISHTALARGQNCSQRVDFPAAMPVSVRGNPRVGCNFGRVPQGFPQNPPLRHQFRLQGGHPCGSQLACTGGFWVETSAVWEMSTGPS